MSSQVLLVDKKDNQIGLSPIDEAHIGRGRHHRAFVTLLFDQKGQVLLQKRKHKLFDGLWDLTAISHPLKINGKTETYQQASDRALKQEMGISHVPIRKIGGFNYFARDGKNCENEYCEVLIGEFGGQININLDKVYESQKISFKVFIEDLKSDPSGYTPWAQKAAKILIRDSTLSVDKVNSAFKNELEIFIREFSKYSKHYFARKQKLIQKYPSLISRIYSEVEVFGRGGKALRPFLVYLGFRVAGGRDFDKILPFCMAIELVHNFLLIHDDIIDKSPIRRGRPTIHKKFEKDFGAHWGISQAMLTGDIAFLEAIKLVGESGFDESIKSKFIDVLVQIILETIYGESLDVFYSFRKSTIDNIWKVAELKTARYSFVGPLILGATLAKANKAKIDALASYGINCGKAFQLQDDILGVLGDEKVLGKSTLSDMREGKNTVLIYKARKMARGYDKKIVDKLWGGEDANLADLVKIRNVLKSSGTLDWCRDEMTRLVKSAKKFVPKITKNEKLRVIFEECADFVINRNK